jgi:hypothetical protein
MTIASLSRNSLISFKETTMRQKIQLSMLSIFLIMFGLMAPAHAKSVGEKIDDGVIYTKIMAKYAADSELSVFDISVSVDNGYVTLKGHVSSLANVKHAVELASKVDGVKFVDPKDLVVNLIK